MASPGLESFCCSMSNTSSAISYSQLPGGLANVYNGLCISSATLSILGAMYQLFPRHPRRAFHTMQEFESFKRQNLQICWLAVADLAASIGEKMIYLDQHLFVHIDNICRQSN